MDIDVLVNQVLVTVLAKIEEIELKQISPERKDVPKILIVSREKNQEVLQFSDSDIAEKYEITYSVDNDHAFWVADYEEIIVRQLDCENLTKLSQGMFDSPYLKLIGQSILEGKEITVISDDMEQHRYRESAPKGFLDMMSKKLDIVKSWGIKVKSIEDVLYQLKCKGREMNGCFADKKVITANDISRALSNDIRMITVDERAIVTDIAKEFAEKNRVIIKRQ